MALTEIKAYLPVTNRGAANGKIYGDARISFDDHGVYWIHFSIEGIRHEMIAPNKVIHPYLD